MIVGLGIDVCYSQRVAKLIARYGERFCRRVLTHSEMSEMGVVVLQSAFVCRRIAAKEAVAKALGSGIARGVGWQQIGIGHLESGQPVVQLTGVAKQRLGQKNVHISITDERDMAMAVAVIDA